MVQIYGTLGPSCAKAETLSLMLQEGLTGMRLNLSHTSIADAAGTIDDLRRACIAQGREMQLLIDMHGPEIRTGWLKKPFSLEDGELVILKARRSGEDRKVIAVPPAVLKVLQVGDHLLIHDGKVEIEVQESLPPDEENMAAGRESEENMSAARESIEGSGKDTQSGRRSRFLCRTVRGGRVQAQKSVKVVGKEIYGPLLTASDMQNLAAAEAMGVTALMQPFVRSGDEIREIRKTLRDMGLSLKIFAKIESMEGVRNLESIIPEADVIVIARGDLGNDMPLWELPGVQKQIAEKCRVAGRPFMVVTQMLDSMTERPVPTRAEVLDIFNAVLDGASYVMVTGETAVGKYPAEVIRYLSRTAREAETYLGGKETEEGRYIWRYETPEGLGNLCMTSDGTSLTGLWFENGPDGKKAAGAGYRKACLPVFEKTSRWLDGYFAGSPGEDMPPIKLPGLTAFRREVIEVLRTIPYGRTMTYGEIAARLEEKGASRRVSAQAVGQAVGWNPVCILIPCHRVMGAGGKLTGYGGGLENKRRLLLAEGIDITGNE